MRNAEPNSVPDPKRLCAKFRNVTEWSNHRCDEFAYSRDDVWNRLHERHTTHKCHFPDFRVNGMLILLFEYMVYQCLRSISFHPVAARSLVSGILLYVCI